MLKYAAAALFAFTLVPAASAAPSEEQCKAAFAAADSNKNGVLDGAEAAKYLNEIKKSGKTYDENGDGKLDQAEFLKACKDGVFSTVK